MHSSFDFSIPANPSLLYDELSKQPYPDALTIPPMQAPTQMQAAQIQPQIQLPQLQWPNNQHQTNLFIQCIHFLAEMVMKLKTENTAYEARFSTLYSNTSTSSNTINDILQQPAQPELPPLPQPKQDDFPLNWKDWHETAERQHSKMSDKNHNMRYLEDENDRLLNHTSVMKILECMRGMWHSFHNQNLINTSTTWTSMLLGLKKALHYKLAKSYPVTNLGKDEWKINKLAKDHYPSFKQTWFMNKTEEKEKRATK
ncbi:hypothetical protein EV363DRAFT_1296536 [Boletus edulis]|nr:hypothetical protein EV363DRAFT_1296536 [Boletus edulis]